MTETQTNHDQDADPPTADGEEPDAGQLRPGSEPASPSSPARKSLTLVEPGSGLRAGLDAKPDPSPTRKPGLWCTHPSIAL